MSVSLKTVTPHARPDESMSTVASTSASSSWMYLRARRASPTASDGRPGAGGADHT